MRREDFTGRARCSSESPTLFKPFPLRFNQDCLVDKSTATKGSSKMQVGLMMILLLLLTGTKRDTQQDKPDQHRFSDANKKIASWST